MKITALAATAAFVCSMGVAAAQPAGPPEPAGPEVVNSLISNQAMAAATAGKAAMGGRAQNGATNTPTGWNYFHATYCEWYYDGTNNWLFVYPQEGGYWYYANNIYVTNTYETACVNGNWVAVWVYNGSTGAYNYVWTYPYK